MSPRSGEWGVIVVGAGPAGSAVAARLAVAGHRALVVDRAEFPRRKPCGDCVNPAAVGALARLGALDRVLAEPHAELEGWRIRPGRDDPFEGRFPGGARGIGIARERLDMALLEHARSVGVEARLGMRVGDVLRSGSRVTGVRGIRDGRSVELRAELVVGADGLRSVVSRKLGLRGRGARLWKVALTARVRGIAVADPLGELRALPWGSLGIAPIGDGLANVTVVFTGANIERLRGRRDECFDSVLASSFGLGGARREGAVLATGPFDLPIRSAVGDGVMLVGDAAGYYDPFTGQGIYRALHGAELAATTADAAIRGGSTSASALRPYELARRREFGPGERLQRLIEAVTSRPRLLSLAAAGLRRRPALADALIAVTGDVDPVRTLARPHLYGP